MQVKQPPKYQDKGRTYVADRCKSLTFAAQNNQITFHALARAGYPGLQLGAKDLPGLLSVGYWDATTNQQWGLGTHRNEGIELAFLETGSLVFAADKKTKLKSGAMTITRPWQPHSLGDPNVTPGRLHWLILDVDVRKPHQPWCWPNWFILTPADLKELTILLRQNELPVWQAGSKVADGFKQIAEVLQSPDSLNQLSKMTILINELFLGLYETLKTRRIKLEPELTSSSRTVELFLSDLRGNIGLLSQQWDIQSLADYCDLGVTQFTRLCKTQTNMTPMQYLNYQRIEAAVNILAAQPELTITDIAFRCGFNSSQYFATVFKRFKGASPGDYQRGAKR